MHPPVRAIRSSSREVPWPSREPALKSATPCGSVKLTQTDLSLVNITDTEGKGKVRIISVVPSLDTTVCEQQTHYLSEKNKGLDKMVELVTVSIDTPFAQKRFAEEAHITNVTFLSDYRDADFGKTYGLFFKDPHILARTVMVVDAHNTVRYLQITPELAQLPDMDEAFPWPSHDHRKLVCASPSQEPGLREEAVKIAVRRGARQQMRQAHVVV